MPSTIVKEYIVLKGTSASFTQHLTKPLNDVIKTDLVSITIGPTYTITYPIIFIQSVNLGGAIQTPDNSKSYWRIAAPPSSSGAGFTVLNQRVDTYLDAQRNITDIDITLLDSNNNLLLAVTSVVIVVEVERRVNAYPQINTDTNFTYPGLIPPR
jgi:hypothetical protein